jgi:hypothetical protein
LRKFSMVSNAASGKMIKAEFLHSTVLTQIQTDSSSQLKAGNRLGVD